MVPLVKVRMPPREILMPALEQILYSGIIAEGAAVYEFEAVFARQFGLPNALGMSSGTAALHTALVMAGVGHGDEVISTPMTAEPTNIAIVHAGAMPVWADVNPDDGTIDPESIAARVTARTKAIMLVHYAGYPVRMAEVLEVAKKANLPVIEDCAHALGASYDGRPIGTLGDFGIFSFQAIKHMTTVDGGVLTIRNESLISRAKRFRWFGLPKGVARAEANITEAGYKYNMQNVGATIGLAQLQSIDGALARHRANGEFYDREFERIPGFSPARFDKRGKPSYWIYTLLCDDSSGAERRLQEAGIAASKLHKPSNQHALFGAAARGLPGLDRFYGRLLHLPCGWWVDDDTRQLIVETLRKG